MSNDTVMTAQAATLPVDPYAEFGGAALPPTLNAAQSSAPAPAVDPYAEFGGKAIVPTTTADTSEAPTPTFNLKQAFGPQTAVGSPLTPTAQQEVSGVSDILHGNFRQGAGKIWDSERPHVIPGSAIEGLIQKFNPDFHGAATTEFQQANEPAINKPLIDTAQFIDKKQHPVQKAIAEASQAMTSPGNVAVLIATGGLGLVENPVALGMANRLLSAGFAANAIGSLYAHSKSFQEAYDGGDSVEAKYQMTHALLSGTISALAATHAAGGSEAVAAKTTELADKAAKIPGQIVPAVKAAITPFDTLANYVAKGNEEFNIPLSRGQAGGPIAGPLETGLRKIPIVNRPFTKLGSVQSEALNAAADKIIGEGLSGETSLSPAERGQKIQDALDTARSQAGKGYEDAMDNLVQTGAAVYNLDTQPLKDTAQTLIESLQPAEGYEGLVSPGRTRALNLLHDIAENDQPLTAGDAIKLRRQLSEEISNPTGEMKPYKAVLSKMRGALNDEISNTLSTFGKEYSQGTPEADAAANQFLRASSRYSEVKEALRNRVVKSITRSDPQAVGALLLGRISPDVAASLKNLSPKALVPVGDSLLQTIFDKVQTKNSGVLTGEDLGKAWDDLDDKVKSTVFGPELPKIQRFVDLVKKIDLEKPKSVWSGSKIAGGAAAGTAAGVEIGTALVGHVVPPFSALAAGLGLGGYEIGKILTGSGGEAFMDTLKASTDEKSTPEARATASEKLQKMGKAYKSKTADSKE